MNNRVIKLESFRHDPHLLKKLISTYEIQTKQVISEIDTLLLSSSPSPDSLKQKVHLLQGSTKYFYEGPLVNDLDVFLSDPNKEKFKALTKGLLELIDELNSNL